MKNVYYKLTRSVFVIVLFFFICGLSACPEKEYYYKDGSNPSHTLIMRTPETGSGPFPAIVYIHGGEWGKDSIDKTFFSEGIKRAAEKGFVAVSIDYHLTPLEGTENTEPWPDQLNDAKDAVAWLRSKAAEYKIDPGRIYVIGHSAGAHIALMMALTNSTLNNPYYDYDENSDVQKVCAVAGPTNLLALYFDNGIVKGTRADNVSEIFNALIDVNPTVIRHDSECSESACSGSWYDGECIDFNSYCYLGEEYTDLTDSGYTLEKTSPIENLRRLPKRTDGTTGHVPIYMIAADIDTLVPKEHQHYPFYSLLDGNSKKDKIYPFPSTHDFILEWSDDEDGIHDQAYAFFRSNNGQ